MDVGLFGHRPRSLRQLSNEHWEIIDGMDQMIPTKLLNLLRVLRGETSDKEPNDEQCYNVYVYKVLPYPPGSKEDLRRRLITLPI
jgi:hypothetical protein